MEKAIISVPALETANLLDMLPVVYSLGLRIADAALVIDRLYNEAYHKHQKLAREVILRRLKPNVWVSAISLDKTRKVRIKTKRSGFCCFLEAEKLLF